ncbi:MAG TPA: sialidase family protein [Candidatus Thermoplasmatota archaeon]|nr:sialidase family protein [Candidatus Thermoplasmatota archaeon]
MRRLVPAVLLMLLAAGCVAPAADTGATPASFADGRALLACFEAACNFEATTVNTEGNEVTIAVNPTDPLNIVAGAKDYSPWTAGDCVWDGIYVTKDGGRTWINHHVPGSPHLLVGGNTSWQPTYASQFWCTTDPVVAFGPDGTCYFSLMAYQADPITASKLGEGTPLGGLNDWAFNRAAQLVAVSNDGCVTFDYMTPIFDGTFPVNFHDKQWIEVGADGTVHVAWLSFFVPGNQYFRSLDKGRTWEGPIVLSTWAETLTPLDGPGGPAGQGTIITVGNGGKDVYVSWNAAGGIVVAISHDGGASFADAILAVETEDAGMEAEYRSGGMPFIVADDSADSPHYGNVYLAWQDTRDGDRDIFVSRSTDGGKTWSEPVKVSDAPRGDQFFPAMSVGPDGILDVVFYDRRDDAENKLLHLYYTFSTDGGLTWSANQRVTEVATDPTKSHHQNGMIFIGDYIDIDSSAGAAHPVWVDTRHGVADVFTATLLRGPLAADALPPGATAGATFEVTA